MIWLSMTCLGLVQSRFYVAASGTMTSFTPNSGRKAAKLRAVHASFDPVP
jgi:hypothetical protein